MSCEPMNTDSSNEDSTQVVEWCSNNNKTLKRPRAPLKDLSNRTKRKTSFAGKLSAGDESDTIMYPDESAEFIAQVNQNLDPCYAQDIHETHLDNEERTWKARSWAGMDEVQTEVNQQMRGILVDWLIEVAEEYNLKSQTLFLTVNYVDRVLEGLPIARSMLQLIGVSCMLIACKYEEIYAPLIEDFVYITDNTYRREDILRSELVVLNALRFDLTVVTVKNFLTRFLLIAGVNDPRVVAHASYMAEMTLPVYSFQKNYRPSQLAAAIVVLSKYVYNLPVWSSVFEACTEFTQADVRQCIHDLYQVYNAIAASPPGKLTAAREKYRQPKYFCVADMPLPSTLPL